MNISRISSSELYERYKVSCKLLVVKSLIRMTDFWLDQQSATASQRIARIVALKGIPESESKFNSLVVRVTRAYGDDHTDKVRRRLSCAIRDAEGSNTFVAADAT